MKLERYTRHAPYARCNNYYKVVSDGDLLGIFSFDDRSHTSIKQAWEAVQKFCDMHPRPTRIQIFAEESEAMRDGVERAKGTTFELRPNRLM